MALGLWPCKFSSTNLPLPRDSTGKTRTLTPTSAILLIANTVPFKALKFSWVFKNFKGQAAGKESFETKDAQGQNRRECNGSSELSILQGDDEMLRQLSMAKDAEEALSIIANKLHGRGSGGIGGSHDCAVIIAAALGRNNVDLAFSIMQAMRRNSIQKKLQQKLGGIPQLPGDNFGFSKVSFSVLHKELSVIGFNKHSEEQQSLSVCSQKPYRSGNTRGRPAPWC